MITFGEPVEGSTQSPVKSKPKGRPARRSTGWHKTAGVTWKARQRAKDKKANQLNRLRIMRIRKDPVSCPRCYAPVVDGVCQGAYSMANGGLHDER